MCDGCRWRSTTFPPPVVESSGGECERPQSGRVYICHVLEIQNQLESSCFREALQFVSEKQVFFSDRKPALQIKDFDAFDLPIVNLQCHGDCLRTRSLFHDGMQYGSRSYFRHLTNKSAAAYDILGLDLPHHLLERESGYVVAYAQLNNGQR